MKKLLTGLLLITTFSSSQAMIMNMGNTDGPDVVETCGTIPVVSGFCVVTTAVTSGMTILLHDNDSSRLTEEAVNALIFEVENNTEEVPASLEIAGHFETSVESIQLAVEVLLQEGEAVTIENIGSKL